MGWAPRDADGVFTGCSPDVQPADGRGHSRVGEGGSWLGGRHQTINLGDRMGRSP